MTTNNISFAVSTEELLVILGYLKAESMPGVDGSHLQGLDRSQLELALGIAERALYARGFIIPDPQNKPILAPTVFSVVGACAMPETTIFVAVNRPNTRKEEYYHHASLSMVVMRYELNSGIHQFVAVPERGAIAQSILSALQLKEKPALACPPIQVKASVFGEARKASLENRSSDALQCLTETGADVASAQALIETHSKPIANTTIGQWKRQDGKETSGGFTVVEGENGIWIVSTNGNFSVPDPVLLASPVSAEDVIQRIKTLVY